MIKLSSDLIMVLSFIGIIVIGFAGTILSDKKEISELENRTLAVSPEFTVEAFFLVNILIPWKII